MITEAYHILNEYNTHEELIDFLGEWKTNSILIWPYKNTNVWDLLVIS